MTISLCNTLLARLNNNEIKPFEAFNELITNQTITITHDQAVGNESQITLNYKDKCLIDLYISPEYENKHELGAYKGLEIKNESDYNRAIIKGDAEFVMSELLHFISLHS